MISSISSVEKQVKAFCARIGKDPLLVQGAGGNVSWKDGGVLWVKASGTWLAEAESKEIFVPVKLAHLQDALAERDFFVKPEVTSHSSLRPSIETLLHALMPHRFVVHLHAVEILCHLIRSSSRQIIERRAGDTVRWIFVDYCKPGADLAKAVYEELKYNPDADVVFMANHGFVIGADDIAGLSARVTQLVSLFKTVVPKSMGNGPQFHSCNTTLIGAGYSPCKDRAINSLATDASLKRRVSNSWALYPDHVVFLGARPAILNPGFTTRDLASVLASNPPFIFCFGDGVYCNEKASPMQSIQLRCYRDVLVRQDRSQKLRVLHSAHISELLDWDAERHRQSYSS